MSKQAPQFRPRRTKAQQKSRRYLWLAVAAGGAVVIAVGVVVGIILAGGDDNSTAPAGLPTPASVSTAGSQDGRRPVLPKPAAQYVIQAGDVVSGYKTLGAETYVLSALGFATAGYFTSRDEGERLAEQWGYLDGYQSSFEPDGQLAGVLKGRYYIHVESYLFEAASGAAAAFAQVDVKAKATPASEAQATKGLGNQSSAYKLITGTVGTSELVEAYYRYIFQRGNLLTVVQVNGAEPFMNIDRARDLAVVVDAKALGERAAPTPTPGKSSTQLPVPPPATPTR